MDFPQLMADCAANVSVLTMSAVVEQESRFNPYAIGINGDYILDRQPTSKAEAIEVIGWLEKEGQNNLDLGIAQISTENRKKFKLSVSDSLDPCLNIKVGAEILTDNYHRALNSGLNQQDALQAAISEYNTGSRTAGYSNGYVQKVLDNAQQSTVVVPDLIANSLPTNTQSIIQPVVSSPEKDMPEENVYSSSHYEKENIYFHNLNTYKEEDIFIYSK